MKFNGYHIMGTILILLWVAISAGEPNFGFVPMNGGETIGYNFSKLIMPFIGLVLIVRGFSIPKK